MQLHIESFICNFLFNLLENIYLHHHHHLSIIYLCIVTNNNKGFCHLSWSELQKTLVFFARDFMSSFYSFFFCTTSFWYCLWILLQWWYYHLMEIWLILEFHHILHLDCHKIFCTHVHGGIPVYRRIANFATWGSFNKLFINKTTFLLKVHVS